MATRPLNLSTLQEAAAFSAVLSITPAAAATDIATFGSGDPQITCYLRRIRIYGVCTSGGLLSVGVFRSDVRTDYPTVGTVTATRAQADKATHAGTGLAVGYAANPPTLGGARSKMAQRPLLLGTPAAPSAPLVIEFERPPAVRNLNEWLAINLGGQPIPDGTVLTVEFDWFERVLPAACFVGDSTTSNANFMFNELARTEGLENLFPVRNCGSNGMRLVDYINNTSSPPFPLSQVRNFRAGLLPVCYGINDTRNGATDREELIALLNTAVDHHLDPAAGVWCPDTKIVLWGPNSLTTDNYNGLNFVTQTGLFSGMTMAEAAQEATDIMYDAYESFSGSPRVFAVLQKQDFFGRTCKTVAESGFMKDQLHPNDRGEIGATRLAVPTFRRGWAAYMNQRFPL